MSTQAKYGWAIGLIVAGIVGALPFRNTNPTIHSSEQVAQKSEPDTQGKASPGSDGVTVVDANGIPGNSPMGKQKSRTRNSRLLPDSSKSLAQFDDIKEYSQPTNGGSAPGSGTSQIVEQVPKRLDRNQLPDSINNSILDQQNENRKPSAKLGPVALDDSPVRQEMPQNVGPYRMRPVNSSKFRPASQSGSGPIVSTASRSRRVVQYKLRDGDSLRTIAKRYLGDENRFKEILADNQHILTNGESFLPVGQFITIIVQ